MWTPKRVLILLGAFTLFVAGFLVYAFFLGNIDGLPPFPVEYLKGEPSEIGEPPAPNGEKKLALAFGNDCEELRRPILLDLNSKGFVMAAGQMEILEGDGRVKLWPFSAALFPKNRTDIKVPEINVVKSAEAYLTLDKAVTSLTELNSRKIVGVELSGGKEGKEVVLINNRGTPERHDDIELVITRDSLWYDERKNLIWTAGYVKLQDYQTQPHPTLITAKGMDLHLAKDATPGTVAKKPGKKGDALQGVDLLILKANVEMHFYVDGRAGFLGGAAEKKAPETAPPPERSHVVVKTPGKFQYDLGKELAWFDSLEANPKVPVSSEGVTVLKRHKVAGGVEKIDQMGCDHLELQFRRKPRDTSSSKEARGVDKEIETALATARAGSTVSLEMNSEDLAAWGSELHYRCPNATTGPQTTLKGNPMNAVKEGHKIQCQELHMVGADKKGMGQQAFAKGPGQIDLFDKTNAKNPYPFHAFWKDSLISTKDRDGEKVFDLLTLTGDAAFLDEEHKQELQGQRLQVWLDQPGKPKAASSSSPPTGSQQRPYKVDAFERVTMHSPELMIKRTNHLTVIFKNEDVGVVLLPDRLPESKGPESMPAPAVLKGELAPPTSEVPAKTPLPAKDVKTAPVLGAPTDKTPPSTVTPRKANPIYLEANEVVAYIASKGAKKELLEVVCEGAVHVHQDGQGPKDKGVEVTGELLNLVKHSGGDVLEVYGDSRKTAYLQLGELILQGPKVVINQKTNVAEINGPGAMQLPSNKSFDGGKSTKPGARLTIHWNKDMIFNGKDADFNGGVLAYQDDAAMKCDMLQVTLDRVVSLKEGQKGDQKAAVEKFLCHRKVYIEDRTLDLTGVLRQYNRLIASELAVDNLEGPTIAYGPRGRFMHIGLGNQDSPLGGKPGALPPPPSKTKKLVHKRTTVDFDGRMFSNTKTTARNAKFYDNVEVIHDTTADPNTPLDPDKLGEDGFYMRCDVLTVFTRMEGGKSTQEMEAKGKIFFKTMEFSGRADVIKYDEANETIIFEGTPGNPTSLYKNRGIGVEPQEIKGNKILYNRRTGEFHLEGGKV